MLDDGLQDHGLFNGAMMGTETCLGGCMEVPGISLCSQALVHGCHEQFGKRGGDRDASMVVWCVAMSFTFV